MPWVLVSVLAVLLVGGAAFSVGTVVHGDPEPVDDAATTLQPVDTATDASTTGSRTDSATGATGAAEAAPDRSVGPDAEAAGEIATLIGVSVNDKTDIAGAAADLHACRRIPAAVATFESAARSRGELVRRITALDVSALEGGQELVHQLEQAWTASRRADDAYVRWARSLRPEGKGCPGDRAALREATRLSASSHPHKQAAARMWGLIAEEYDLLRVEWKQL